MPEHLINVLLVHHPDVRVNIVRGRRIDFKEPRRGMRRPPMPTTATGTATPTTATTTAIASVNHANLPAPTDLGTLVLHVGVEWVLPRTNGKCVMRSDKHIDLGVKVSKV